MRVLVVADGTRGDVQPMRVMASALHDEGHSVTLAAPPSMRASIEQHGLRFVPLALDSEQLVHEVSDAIVAGPRAVRRMAPRYLAATLESQMQVLPELFEDADFVLAGGLHLAVPSLSERYAVPWRWVVYSVTLLPSSWHPPMLLPIGCAPRAVNWLGWQITRRLLNRMLLAPLNAERARLGLPSLPDIAQYLQCSNPIVAVDAELAPLAPDMQHYDLIGHLAPEDDEPLPDVIEEFLAAGPPPLYVGFGSMTDPDAARTTELAVEACRSAGCRLLLSRGWAGLGEAPLPEGCLAIGPVNHARLFPRVAGIVHHGGSGTTAAATRAGRPQLVVPHLADQFHFGALVHALGVAPKPLRRMHLRADRLAARVSELLADQAMHARARELGARIAARPRFSHASRLLTVAAPARRPSLRPAPA